MSTKTVRVYDPIVDVLNISSTSKICITSNGTSYALVEGELRKYGSSNNGGTFSVILYDVCAIQQYLNGVCAACVDGKIFICVPSDDVNEPTSPDLVGTIDVTDFFSPFQLICRPDLNMICLCSTDGKFTTLCTSEYSENSFTSNANGCFLGPLDKGRVVTQCRVWGVDEPILVLSEQGSDLFLYSLTIDVQNPQVVSKHSAWVTALSEGSHNIVSSADCAVIILWRVENNELHAIAELSHDGFTTCMLIDETASLLWCACDGNIECYAIDALRGGCELLRVIGAARHGIIDGMHWSAQQNELITIDTVNATIIYYPIPKQLTSQCNVSLELPGDGHCTLVSLCCYIELLQVIVVVNQHGAMSLYSTNGKHIRDIKNIESSYGKVTSLCHQESAVSKSVSRVQLFVGYSTGKVSSLLLIRTQLDHNDTEHSLTALDLVEPNTTQLHGDKSSSSSLDVYAAPLHIWYKCPLAVTRMAVSEQWLILSHMHFAIYIYSRSEQRVAFQVDLPDMLQDLKFIESGGSITHMLLLGRESCNVLCLSSFVISHAIYFSSFSANESASACSLTYVTGLLEDMGEYQGDIGVVVTSSSNIYSFDDTGALSLVLGREHSEGLSDPTAMLPVNAISFTFDESMFVVCSLFRAVIVLKRIDSSLKHLQTFQFDNQKARVISAQVVQKKHTRRFDLNVVMSSGNIFSLRI